jgi:hypothetical protein
MRSILTPGPNFRDHLSLAWVIDPATQPHHAEDTGRNLRGANLYETDLSRADISGANLLLTDLSRADLRGANLRESFMRGADLIGADLSGADLYLALMGGVILCNTTMPDGSVIYSGC